VGSRLAHQGEQRFFLPLAHTLSPAQAHPAPHTLYVQAADGTNPHLYSTVLLRFLNRICVQTTRTMPTGEAILIFQKIAHRSRLTTPGEDVLRICHEVVHSSSLLQARAQMPPPALPLLSPHARACTPTVISALPTLPRHLSRTRRMPTFS